MSRGITADDLCLITLFAKRFNFEWSSDISAWNKALGLGNQLKLTEISSYPILSYPK